MKGIWIILIILLALGLWAVRRDNSPANDIATEEWLTYADPEGVFTFEYKNAWNVSGRSGPLVATVNVPRSYMPQTNFSDAKLAITWTGAATDATCQGRTESREAAAGNLYDKTVIRKIYDGDCYVFEYVIHSTNLANYDENQDIEEFDKDKIISELERAINSFRYLPNSD